MKRILLFTIILILLIHLVLYGEIESSQKKYNVYTHTIGVEANMLGMIGTGVSYSYRFEEALLGQDLFIQGSIALPIALTFASSSLDSLMFTTGARAFILPVKPFGVSVSSDTYLLTQKQVLGTFVSCGFLFQITPGLYFDRWQIGIGIRLLQNLATHISHSDFVADTFEDRYLSGDNDSDGPRDGWYLATATRLSLGLDTAFSFTPLLSVYLTGGITFTFSRDVELFDGMSFGLLPFYAELGTRFRF